MSHTPLPASLELPLSRLLSKLVDDLIEAEEMRELEAILEESAAARSYYRDYLATHLELTESQPINPAALVDFNFESVRTRSKFKPLLAVAAMLALAAVPLLWWASRDADLPAPDLAGPPSAVSSLPVLGVISRLDGVEWNLETRPLSGTRIGPGAVELESGRVQLDLVGGQSVTVRAPARFELLSESEMLLSSGDASLSNDSDNNNQVFIIRVPGGAVVDSGSELSIKVATDGTSDVRVFEGHATASVLGDGDRTREERLLGRGESVHLSNKLEPSSTAELDFVRPFAAGEIAASPAGDLYARRVALSKPVSWWRFERTDAEGAVPDEAGGHPLMLEGTPRLRGSGGAGFMETGSDDAKGYGMTRSGIAGLDTKSGQSIECLLYSRSEKYATALALELDAPEGSTIAKPAGVSHPPQRALIERMSRRGGGGHLHPDFGIRGMSRAPAAYYGGFNTYTEEAYLLHRWMHVVLTFDGIRMRLYFDGRLSDELAAAMPASEDRLRPIIGRLQSKSSNDFRPWVGGIDEVALYGRALGPDEVRAHFEALGD